jgi:hypothetical protein
VRTRCRGLTSGLTLFDAILLVPDDSATQKANSIALAIARSGAIPRVHQDNTRFGGDQLSYK